MNEIKNQIQVTYGEILFLLFFGTLLLAKGIGLYDGQGIFKVILLFSVSCIVLKICIEKYTFFEYLKMFLVLFLVTITYLISGEKGLFLYGLVVIGMKYVSLKRSIWIGTVVWTLSFWGTTIFHLVHRTGDVYKVHAKLGIGHIFRWSLGYAHPNVLQISYLVFAFFVILLLEDKFRWKHALLLFVGNCWIFLFSVSYTGFVLCFLLLLGRIYLMYRKKIGKMGKKLLQLIFPTCLFCSLVAPVTLTGKAFYILDQLLSTRMWLAKKYLAAGHISLFGLKLEEVTTEVSTMDNAYVFAFITYGIVPFSLICISIMYMINYYLKKEKYIYVLIILTIVIGGLTEPFLFNSSFKNISFLFMGTLFYNGLENKQSNKFRKKWGIYSKGNKSVNIEINKMKLSDFNEKRKNFWKMDTRKNVCGIICAGLMLIMANFMIVYPSGYIVYRSDCADLTKEKHYYVDGEKAYDRYKKMNDFIQGDEIEYFSGNIVKMEFARNNLFSVIIGYFSGYVLCCIFFLKVRKKC